MWGIMVFHRPDQFYIGTEEVHVWLNKPGDPKTDEFALQFLVVWRM